MLRIVLSRKWLSQAPPKLKRPYHVMMSALRAVSSDIRNPEGLAEVLRVMGQLPFHWRAPDGYPDDAEYWGGFALARWSFGAWFTEEDDVIRVEWRAFDDSTSTSDFLAQIGGRFFGGALPTAERRVLTSFLSKASRAPEVRREAIGLAVSSPAFQWY